MTINAGDMPVYQLNSGKRDRVLLQARAVITGAAGVVVQPLAWQDDPGITIVRGASAGLYNITFPKAADVQGVIGAQGVSPAGTVKNAFGISADFQAGIASIQFVNAAGASTDPAAGDSFTISMTLSMRRDF